VHVLVGDDARVHVYEYVHDSPGAGVVHVRPVTEEAPTRGGVKKHRHDLGQEDHGSKLAAGTTRAIQGLLGLWIALTLVFIVYALVDATH
jgi:hypothetical protein